MNERFAKGERFVVWDMACIHEAVPMPSGGTARKTELVVSKLGAGEPAEKVGTLSTPIARKAIENVRDGDGQPSPGSFPVLVYWDEVESDFPNDAVVLRFDKLLEPDELSETPSPQGVEFSLEPITAEQAPF